MDEVEMWSRIMPEHVLGRSAFAARTVSDFIEEFGSNDARDIIRRMAPRVSPLTESLLRTAWGD